MIAVIENALIERLREKLPDINITACPDDPGGYLMNSADASVLVHYAGSVYGELKDAGAVVQERTVKFDIVIVSRGSAEDDSGAYPLLEAARLAVSGYKISGCKPMYPVSDGWTLRTNDIWQYTLTVLVPASALEIKDEIPSTLITKLRAESTYNIVEVQK